MSGFSNLFGAGQQPSTAVTFQDPLNGSGGTGTAPAGSPSTGNTWADSLLYGVSAIIDSQVANKYATSNPTYNTAGGVAGTYQGGARPVLVAGGVSPVVLILAAIAIFLVLKK